MRSLLNLFIVALLPFSLEAFAASPEPELNKRSTRELEERIEAIDRELGGLSRISLRTGSGSIGYRSKSYPDPTHQEWVQVDLPQDTAIDQIVLVPSVWRDAIGGFKADGFPETFSIIAGRKGEETGHVVASFSPSDGLLPRIAPLIVPCTVTAAWVRVECDHLPIRGYDEQYNLELSELFLFSGEKNVALHQPVSHGGERSLSIAHRGEFLVDGFTPYFMNTGQGDTSRPFLAIRHDQLSITVDLGSVTLIDGLHLHAAELNDTAPQGLPSSHGIPRQFQVEAAKTADFSDAVLLATDERKSIYQVGPILMMAFPETAGRYVRIKVIEPYLLNREVGRPSSRTSFAELEIYSEGKNVALHQPVELETPGEIRHPAASLTDGRNLYGRILPIRQWMNELARRHELERERPLFTAQLNQRYARQQINLRRLGWLSALLAGGIVITFLLDRLLRMRHIARMKERFAANLHDELGANLHTIGLLSDLARRAKASPVEVDRLHQRIRSVTEQLATAVRHCTNLLESRGLYTDLRPNMNRIADRIMIEYDITIEGEQHLSLLNSQTIADLFLFYKECLINISRHAHATRFDTHVLATPKEITLVVHDNGRGFSGQVPSSLKRRAKLLGARVTAACPRDGGTLITLTLRPRRKQRSRL